MNTPTDWNLIQRCRMGSAAAFEPLVRRYEADSLAFAGAMLGDPDDAQDAVQDAFVRAYRSLHRLTDGSEFGPWLRSILRNLCIDRLRQVTRHARTQWDQAVIDSSVWSEPDGPAAVERERLSNVMRSALERLSVEHREVLIWKEIEGLSYASIAELTGASVGTVGSRLFNARAAMRKILEESS